MARITVEDCLKRIDNQFDLILIAAKRARRIANGADALVDVENDKPTVIALREIAAGLMNEEIFSQMAQPEEDLLSSEEAEELLASTPVPGSSVDTKAPPAAVLPSSLRRATPAPIAPAFNAPAVEPAPAVVPAPAIVPAPADDKAE